MITVLEFFGIHPVFLLCPSTWIRPSETQPMRPVRTKQVLPFIPDKIFYDLNPVFFSDTLTDFRRRSYHMFSDNDLCPTTNSDSCSTVHCVTCWFLFPFKNLVWSTLLEYRGLPLVWRTWLAFCRCWRHHVTCRVFQIRLNTRFLHILQESCELVFSSQ